MEETDIQNPLPGLNVDGGAIPTPEIVLMLDSKNILNVLTGLRGDGTHEISPLEEQYLDALLKAAEADGGKKKTKNYPRRKREEPCPPSTDAVPFGKTS